jgi:hypothetical protein
MGERAISSPAHSCFEEDCMEIQNPLLAGQRLGLRYTRNDDGTPITVSGDERGVFDVPEKDGEFLLGTPGWTRPRKAREATSEPERGDPTVPVKVTPPPLPPPPPSEEEEDEPPDFDDMDREELFAYAAEHDIETNKRWATTRLRAQIEAAVSEEED